MTSATDALPALNARIAEIERLQRASQALFAEQASLLEAPGARDALTDPERALGSFVSALAASALRVIALLKASDTPNTRRDFVLAEEALQRWQPLAASQCALLLSLLARAAQGVDWAIPAAPVRGWCDPICPHHWARALLLPIQTQAEHPWPDPSTTLRQLKSAHQIARAQLAQQLGTLRTAALMERNRLAREEDAA